MENKYIISEDLRNILKTVMDQGKFELISYSNLKSIENQLLSLPPLCNENEKGKE